MDILGFAAPHRDAVWPDQTETSARVAFWAFFFARAGCKDAGKTLTPEGDAVPPRRLD